MGVMGEWVFFSLLLFLFWFTFSLIGANDKNKVFYWSITKTKTIKVPIHPTHPVKLTATEESFRKTSTPQNSAEEDPGVCSFSKNVLSFRWVLWANGCFSHCYCFLFWSNFSLIGENDKNKVSYWSITKTKTIKTPIHSTHPVKLTATEESFPKTSTPQDSSHRISNRLGGVGAPT